MSNRLDGGNNPYVQYYSASSSVPDGINKILEGLGQCGRRFEVYSRSIEAAVNSVWHYLKISPTITDAALARVHQGTKLIIEGGPEKVFQQIFGTIHGDKYLDSFACYLSTSTGPVNGTLYISSKRLAFCSEFPICYYPSPGQPQWIYYKVVVGVDQLGAINTSTNQLKPTEKDIQIITRDAHEFWFMGFISYNKAFKTLTQALQRSPSHV